MIIPSLDLIEGNVVRLYQGNYKQQYDYSNNPLLFLKSYESQGANTLHLVDLTGAKSPEKRQKILLKTLLKAAKVPIQVGGGVRNRDDINSLLMAGATRVVIGSSAIQQPQETKNWFLEFGVEAIVLALDIRIDPNNCKKIAISGWNKTVDFTLEEVISWYQPLGIKHILCTDISCDGTLNGTNVELYKQISKTYPEIAFQASGGIGSLNDILALRGSGIQGIIIGRALLESKFTVLEAIKCWQNG